MAAKAPETGTAGDSMPGPSGRFLARLAAFAAVLLAVNLAAHSAYVALAVPRGVDARTDGQLAELAPGVRILALGDSHPQRGLAAPRMPRAFTLASSGTNAVMTSSRFRSWLPRLESLDLVLLSVDLHSFTTLRLEGSIEDAYWMRHLDSLSLALRGQEPTLLWRELRGNFAAHVGRRGWLLRATELALGKEPAEILRGWAPLDADFGALPAGERRGHGVMRAALHFEDVDAIDPLLVEAHEEILRACAQAGVAVVLVTYPVTRAYLRAVPAHVEPAVERVITGLQARHPVVVARLDFLREWLDRPAHFSDEDHLGREGAEIFTDELLRRLRDLGLIARRDAPETPLAGGG